MSEPQQTAPPIGAVEGRARDAAALARAMGAAYGPTPEQAAIIEAGTSPTLVVAGAGSGKTETLSMRIVYLLDHAERLFGSPISPDEILCLTFTRKAAAEIAERADERIHQVWDRDADGRLGPRDPSRPAPSVSTYNAYAARLAAEHGLRVGLDPDTTVVTDAALWQLANRTVHEWTELLDTPAAASTLTGGITSFSAQLRDHDVSTERLRAWLASTRAAIEALPKKAGDAGPGSMTQGLATRLSALRTLGAMADLVDDFRARKDVGGMMDFADQVAIAVELSRLPEVQEAERARYKAVLLDEFQDTSPAQLRLFSTLFGRHVPVMAVGDPHQAIYGFRGASSQALADFVEQFGGPDEVETSSLTVSWRNDGGILHAANTVAAPLRATTRVEVPSLMSRATYLDEDEPHRASPGVSAMVTLTVEDEVAAVVDFIEERRRELGHGRVTADGAPRIVSAGVLCRRRKAIQPIADELARRGIDFEVVGLGGLLDRPEVADVVALLESAHDPSRGDALMRLLTSERVNLGPRDLAALHDWAEVLAGPRDHREGPVSIVDALAELPPPGWKSGHGRALTEAATARLTALQETVASIRRHTYLPLTELVVMAERAWGLDIEAAVADAHGRRRRHVDAFVGAVRTFIASAEHATLGAFLAWLDAARHHEGGLDAPVKEPEPGAVQLLTAHAAKGLEWDVVVIADAMDGVFPSVSVPSKSSPEYTDAGWLSGISLPWELRMDGERMPRWEFRAAGDHKELAASIDRFRIDSGAHAIEEERRLFYVALTRARAHVLISGSGYGGGTRPREASLFVRELVDAGVLSDQNWADIEAQDGPPEAQVITGVWPGEPSEAQVARRDLADRVRARMQQLGDATDWSEARGSFAAPIAAMLAERRRAVGWQHAGPPAHLSTSALVSMRRDRDEFARQLRRPVPTEPTVAAQRGSVLHAWIERHFGHTPLLEPEDLGPDEDAQIDVEALKQRFLDSPWAGRRPSDIEVDVEMPIAGVTIRSRIDAVFPAERGLDRVTVVDWKSGAPPRGDDERAAREVQLAVYRLAWSEWKGIPLDQVDAAFYYVGADVTVRPERLWGRAELEELIRTGLALESSGTG